MARMNIYVSDDLKERMDNAEERANWSQVASRAFEIELGEIAKRKDSEPLAKVEKQDKNELGIQISELTPEAARQFGYTENEEGVVVVGVKPGSKADRAGLRQGDLVKEINRNPVRSIDDLRAEVGKSKDKDSMQMLVKRPKAGILVIKIS